MKRPRKTKRRLRTIWRLPDDLWVQLKPLLPPEKPPGTNGVLSAGVRKARRLRLGGSMSSRQGCGGGSAACGVRR